MSFGATPAHQLNTNTHHDDAHRPCAVPRAGAPRHRQLLRLRLHRRRHPRLVPPAALQDHPAPLVARPEPAVRPARHRLGHRQHRQHPDAAREHRRHGLLQGDRPLPLRRRPARHRPDRRAVDVLLLHHAALPDLLPARRHPRHRPGRRGRRQRRHAHLEGGRAGARRVPRLLHRRLHRLRHLRLRHALARPRLGQLPRPPRHRPRCRAIHPADPDHLAPAGAGQLVSADDVHPDPGQLCLCSQSVCPPGQRRMERMGAVHLHRLSAGLSAGYESVVPVEGQEGAEEAGGSRLGQRRADAAAGHGGY